MALNLIVLTAAQKTTAMTLDNDAHAQISPRAVDAAVPGIGLNLNASATGFALNATVTLTGNHVAPKRIIDDPDYQRYCPALVTYLQTMPYASLEPTTIFA